ncbi:hypothetical protein ACTA71_011663 [Dictyostelium dimigraforme]
MFRKIEEIYKNLDLKPTPQDNKPSEYQMTFWTKSLIQEMVPYISSVDVNRSETIFSYCTDSNHFMVHSLFSSIYNRYCNSKLSFNVGTIFENGGKMDKLRTFQKSAFSEERLIGKDVFGFPFVDDHLFVIYDTLRRANSNFFLFQSKQKAPSYRLNTESILTENKFKIPRRLILQCTNGILILSKLHRLFKYSACTATYFYTIHSTKYIMVNPLVNQIYYGQPASQIYYVSRVKENGIKRVHSLLLKA